MSGRRKALVVVLLQIAVAVFSEAPHEARPTAASCREAWRGVPPDRWTYDFTETYDTYRRRLPRQQCRKAWTVLVYMAADYDDLTGPAYDDIAEMEAPFTDPAVSAASTVDADVLVELDLRQPEGIRRLHMFRSPTAMAPGQIRSPVVDFRPDERVEPRQSLGAFVTWGVASYPAERYLVIVWGHGRGWRPALPQGTVASTTSDPNGGLALDESQLTVLDVPSLRQALTRAGRPVDVYISDACLMQSVEVVSELVPVARYIVGAEQIHPFVGLPYRSVLPGVNGTLPLPPAPEGCSSDDSACRVAHLVPAVEHEAFGGRGGQDTFTLSAVDARAFAASVPRATRALSAAITAWVREDPFNAIPLQGLLRAPDTGGGELPRFLGSTGDFGVFLDRLSEVAGPVTPASSALRSAIGQVRRSLDSAVTARSFGSRYDQPEYRGKLGISVWLPHTEDEYRGRLGFYASAPLVAGGSHDWLRAAFEPEPA